MSGKFGTLNFFESNISKERPQLIPAYMLMTYSIQLAKDERNDVPFHKINTGKNACPIQVQKYSLFSDLSTNNVNLFKEKTRHHFLQNIRREKNVFVLVF